MEVVIIEDLAYNPDFNQWIDSYLCSKIYSNKISMSYRLQIYLQGHEKLKTMMALITVANNTVAK